MCNWIIHLDEPSKTVKIVSKLLRISPISHIKLDGISVLDRTKKLKIENIFYHALFSSLPKLRWMGLSLTGMNEAQISSIGKCIYYFKGKEIDIR